MEGEGKKTQEAGINLAFLKQCMETYLVVTLEDGAAFGT